MPNAVNRDRELLGIWSYDINNKSWNLLFKYNDLMLEKLQPNNTCIIQYNSNKHELYVSSSSLNTTSTTFFGIDMSNGKYVYYDHNSTKSIKISMILFINNYIHSIRENSHTIWDCQKEEIKFNQDFADIGLYDLNDLEYCSCAYLK